MDTRPGSFSVEVWQVSVTQTTWKTQQSCDPGLIDSVSRGISWWRTGWRGGLSYDPRWFHRRRSMSKLGLGEITILFLYEMRTFRFGEKGISLWKSPLCRPRGFYCLSESHHFHCLVIGLLVHIVYSFEIKVYCLWCMTPIICWIWKGFHSRCCLFDSMYMLGFICT